MTPRRRHITPLHPREQFAVGPERDMTRNIIESIFVKAFCRVEFQIYPFEIASLAGIVTGL